MAFDETMAERIRAEFTGDKKLSEKKMFGGLCFLYRDHMCMGVMADTLMVRLDLPSYEQALGMPHVRPMDFTGKSMKGFLYVDFPGLESREDLRFWIRKSLDYNALLPAKKPGAKPVKKKVVKKKAPVKKKSKAKTEVSGVKKKSGAKKTKSK